MTDADILEHAAVILTSRLRPGLLRRITVHVLRQAAGEMRRQRRVRRDPIELVQGRKGVHVMPEVGLPEGFVPPSAAIRPDGSVSEEVADRQFLDDPGFERRLRELMRRNPQLLENWIRQRTRINGGRSPFGPA